MQKEQDMANILIPNGITQIAPGRGVDLKAQVPVSKDGSFSQYLQNQARVDKAATDKLAARVQRGARGAAAGEFDGGSESPASVEDLLRQVMQYLQKTLDKPGQGAGQWSFQLKDIGILEQLAAQAGMDAAALATLKKQMEQQGGLPLADLFAALEKNFKELGGGAKVTAPETYLPLLDSFLARLGVSADAIKHVDAKGVNGVDQLDLAAYLQGIKEIPAQQADGQQQAFTLSDWEREQMSAMLAEAGVPQDAIAALFPEVKSLEANALAGLHEGQGDRAVTMTLDRLQAMLQQAMAAAEDARPKANLPGFLNSLHLVLSQAGFQDGGVGWAPVVQGTMQSVYDHLQTMVDGATAKVGKSGDGGAGSSAWQLAEGWEQLKEEKHAQAMAENEALDQQWLSSGDESAAQSSLDPSAELGEALAETKVLQKADRLSGVEAQLQPRLETRGIDPGLDAGAKIQTPRVRFSPELQQFAVEQISQGVLRGLRNNDHHLALTLYPKELGEVKVDLQVRGSHLSVSFVMENQKVKEAMEANMGDFKDNLERRGFTLGEMAVSVDQQQRSPDEGRQQFARAWSEMVDSQGQGQQTLSQPGVIAELNPAGHTHSLHGGGISVFV